MNWLMSILKLIPYVVAGVQVIHQDATAGQKIQIVKDVVGLSSAASQEVLSPQNGAIAAAIGQTANNTIDQLVAALHAPAVEK